MGTVRHYKNDGSAVDETGLFGYSKGARSIFLDSDTGNATFGIQGNGQILIKPDSGTITGGNYKEPEKNDKGEITKAGSGMKIDLKEPSIRFGSENFYVTKEGNLYAQNNGQIAGWKIGEVALTKGKVGMSSDNETEKGNENKAFWAGAGASTKNDAPFSVDFNGNVVMLHAQIGKNNENDVIIDKGRIYTENLQVKENGKIKTYNHGSYDDNTPGFYVGPRGISLGEWFKVNNEGELIAQKGYIGNTTNGFLINKNAICSKGKEEGSGKGNNPAKNGNVGIRLTKSYISLGPNA